MWRRRGFFDPSGLNLLVMSEDEDIEALWCKLFLEGCQLRLPTPNITEEYLHSA